MSRKSPRVFSGEFKLEAVRRILAGEPVRAVAAELQVRRKSLYEWCALFRGGGAPALRPIGRPRWSSGMAATNMAATSMAATNVAERAYDDELETPERIAALERKIGQQQVELDFFQQALRQVEATRRSSTGPGVRGSTRSSKR
jgi:transposase